MPVEEPQNNFAFRCHLPVWLGSLARKWQVQGFGRYFCAGCFTVSDQLLCLQQGYLTIQGCLLKAQHKLAVPTFPGCAQHCALKNPARNPQHSASLFVFSFLEVLALHRHSRSLHGNSRYSTAASRAKLLLFLFYR